MEVIHKHSHDSCEDFCNGEWLNYVLDVLQKNDTHDPFFSDAVQRLLQMELGKSRNILIIGRTNCAKNISTRAT